MSETASFFFFQAEDGIRDFHVTGVQTCALPISGGENPLDRSSVHPEAYGVAEAIAKRNNRKVEDIMGDSAFLRSLNPQDYVTDTFGLPTVKDIIAELEKPGRDPRPEFRFASFE